MTPQEKMMIKSQSKNRRSTYAGLVLAYSSVRELTDDQLRSEYKRMTKDMLIEMIINQEKVISFLMRTGRDYEMKLTENSSTT